MRAITRTACLYSFPQVLSPVEIVIPVGHADRPLFKKVLAHWGSEANPLQTQIGAISRR